MCRPQIHNVVLMRKPGTLRKIHFKKCPEMVTHLKMGRTSLLGSASPACQYCAPLIFPVVTLCDFKRKTCFVLLFTAACSGGNRNVGWRRRRRRCRARNVKKKWFCPPFVQTLTWETWQISRFFLVSSNRSSLRYSVPVEEATFLIFTHPSIILWSIEPQELL